MIFGSIRAGIILYVVFRLLIWVIAINGFLSNQYYQVADNTKTHRILRLILCLSNGYSKTKEECKEFLGIRDTAFYSYCNLLKETGFDLRQKEGRYWIDNSLPDSRVLLNVLHFSEEELYLLSRCIDVLDAGSGVSSVLRKKLVSFLNQDRIIENYISGHKSEKAAALHKAIKDKRQVLLMNYYSGNSETVKNRLVEPFEFKDDFNLVWAFDLDLQQNRQFKVSRIEKVVETPFVWECPHLHRAKPVDIFRNTGELNKEIEIIVNIRARNLLIEEYPLAERYLEMIKGNRFRLKVMVAKYEGPGRFVMGLFENIEVIGGEGFRNFLMLKKEKL